MADQTSQPQSDDAKPTRGHDASHMQHGGRPYLRLLLMALLSFGAMYVLMYAMVDRFANIYANINQAYMAALMAAPMVVIELALMHAMYPNRLINAIALAASAVFFIAAFLGIRQQIAVSDQLFVDSMIPHHGAAVLMCERAPVEDAEIKRLCDQIIASQSAEIAQMKAIRTRL
jgi:hypothetical protein